MKAKLFGYIVLFTACAVLLNYGTRLLLDIWWILAIVGIVILIATLAYRIIQARKWR